MTMGIERNEQGIEVARVYDGPWSNGPTRTFVDEKTVAELLGYLAVYAEVDGCSEEACLFCDPVRAIWWKACNSLSIPARRGLQALMRDAGVALPLGPYEEEEDGVVPTPQHG